MLKNDLWCGRCGTQDFIEHTKASHPNDSRYPVWECVTCEAAYELNDGYGYYTVHWGVDENLNKLEKYSLNTGKLMDDSKLPRTPEGIVRHSGSREELMEYLERTQVK